MDVREEDKKDEQGFALIAVLAFLTLLAIFLAPFATSARLQALVTGNQLQDRRLDDAADAINAYLDWRLSAEPAWKRMVDQGAFESTGCRHGDTDIFVSIIPHAKLTNLNTANASLLGYGLKQVGLDAEATAQVARQLIAFRSPRAAGGDIAGVHAGFKRAPFEDISELHDFEALHDVSLLSLARIFSTQSGRSLPSGQEGSAGPSQHYTIMTVIGARSSSGGRSAIYSAGGSGIAGSRIGSIPADTASASEETIMNCEELLGPELASVLQEADL